MAILGKRGSGKTSYIRKKIFEEARVIVYDVNGDYDLPAYESISSLAKAINRKSSYHVRYVPFEPLEEISKFSKLVFARGDLLVVFDEVHLIAPTFSIDPDMANLFRRGRHRGIKVMFATQRPSGMNNLLTSQASEFVVFRLVNHRDVLYVKENLQIDPSLIRKLDPGFHVRREY